MSVLKLVSAVDDDQPSDQCMGGGYMLWIGYGSARIVNLYEGILILFREFWRPVAYSNSE